MGELFEYALTGVNLIPTILLGLVLVYWITVIIGLIDFDFLDIDFDLDGIDDLDGFEALLGFLNLKDMPVMIVVSILSLVFWVISMFLHFLPIPPGGFLNGLCLIPAFIVSLFLTKVITNPLKGIFRNSHAEAETQKDAIIGQYVTMTCDMEGHRLGQAEVNRDGASILINVQSEIEGETFKKQEMVYVMRKDARDVYYVIKIDMNRRL